MKNNFFAITIALASLTATAQKAELKEASKLVDKKTFSEARVALEKVEPLLDSATDEQKAEYYFLIGQTAVSLAATEDQDKNVLKAISAFKKVTEIEKASKNNKYSAKAEPITNMLLSQIVNAAIADNKNSKFVEASRKFDQAFQLSPKDTLYLYYSASTAISANDFDFAESKYKELVTLNYNGKTVYYTAIDKTNGAEQSFGEDKKMRDLLVRQGSHKDPKTVEEPSRRTEILKNLSLILMNKENYSEAEPYITTAFKENPNDDAILMSLLNLYTLTNRNDKFKEIASEALIQNPKNALLNYNLGIISSNENNDDEAKKYFLKAIEVDPNFENAYLGLANITLKEDAEITNKMNNAGTSSAGQQKFKALKQQKIKMYQTALDYLIKAKLINANNESINSLVEEIENYLNSEK